MRNKLKKFNSIKYKLLTFSIIMSLLPLLLLGGYNLTQAKNYLWESVTYQHSYGTSKVVGEINFLLNEAERVMTVLADINGSNLIDGDVKEQESLLYSCITNMPYVENMSIINADGQKITEVSRLDVSWSGVKEKENTKGFKSADILESVANYQPYISPVCMDSYGQSYFQLAIPVIENGNNLKGAIVANISLRTIVNLLSKVSGTSDSYVFLVDQEGNLIGHEDFSQVLRQVDVSPSLPALSESEEELTKENPLVRTYLSYTGKKVVGSYAKVAGTNWAVVYEQPFVKAFSSYLSLQNTFIISTVVLMLLVLSISLFFVVRFSRELDILKQGVKRITSGEIGFSLPVQSQDEIGQVLNAFNELSLELEKKRELEKSLRQTDKMASLGLLAAGVAHEINNPLATICLSVDELRYELNNNNSDHHDNFEGSERYLDIIAKQAERCSQITQNLLNFARSDNNPDKTPDLYNLNDLIKKAVELTHYIIRKKRIQIVYDLDPALPLLWGDEPGIQQVIFNLLNNSAQAVKDDGHGIIKLTTLTEDDSVLIKVEDNGEGISKENLEHIFEPFFTTKPRGQGTGLGLAVSYGLIQQAGGTISFQSQLGHGTIATIKLPCCKGGASDESLNC